MHIMLRADKERMSQQSETELLRQSKQRLLPLVAQAGYQFHGRAIRRPHPAKIQFVAFRSAKGRDLSRSESRHYEPFATVSGFPPARE